MSAPRPFRFGVTGRGATMAEWRDFARKAEALGYSTLVLPDHFQRQLAPFTALAAAAQATSSLRLGTFVIDNDFRHPALLAKEAATLDVLSDGRLELGIGTGSQPIDNERTGIPLDPPAIRVERFSEMLDILQACFSQDVVTFEGRHYRLRDLPAYPRPVQQRIPLVMGARGRRMLRIAARHADSLGIMSDTDLSYADQIEIVRAAAGERFDAIEFNKLYLNVQVDGKPDPEPEPSPIGVLIGSRDSIMERLVAQRERDLISYVVIIGMAIDAFAPVVSRLAGT